jgi:hypothetical protein
MPSIQVRDVPDQLYRTIAEQAKREHRSLAQQVLVTLERGIGAQPDHLARRKALLDEIRSSPPIECKLDPVALIREDRNR